MQLRHYLSLEEREEAVPVRSRMVEPDVVSAGFEELLHGLEVLLGIEAARADASDEAQRSLASVRI